MKIKLSGKIINGKLHVNDLNMYHYIMDAMNGEKVTVVFIDEPLDKTTEQLAFYFGIIIGKYCMADLQFGGWSKDEIDDHFRNKFLLTNILVKSPKNNMVKNRKLIKSVSSLSIKQMSQFISDVIVYLSSELGIIIPEYDEASKSDQKFSSD